MIASLVGSGSAGLSSISSGVSGAAASIHAFASGTDYAPGGWSLVGERGRELVQLPAGSRVIANPQTERMLGPVSHFADGGYVPALHSPRRFAEGGNSAGGGQGQPNVTFKTEIINNHGSAQVSTREVADGRGGRKQQVIIDEMVASSAGSPATRRAFGLRGPVVRR